MKSYIIKLIQSYLDIIKINESLNMDDNLNNQDNQDDELIQDSSIIPNDDNDDFVNNDYKNHLDNQSELDKIHKGKKFSREDLLQTNTPIIYAFITKYAPNAIKIGYTVQGAEQRVQQWRKYYKDAKLIGWWTATQLDNAMHKVFFMDFNVHARTRSYGYSNLKDEQNKIDLDEFKRLAKEDGIEDIHVSSEFFMKYKDMKIKDPSSELNEKVITDIIKEIKDDISKGKSVGTLYDLETHQASTHHEYGACDTYENTPLQQDAINKALDAMSHGKTDLLLSAVMRFGKTHCCYEIIKESKDIKYVLVTSAKADVRAAWKDDINHKDFLDDFVFVEFDPKSSDSLIISKKNQKGVYAEDSKQNLNMIKQYIDEGKTVIVFATLQDLAGKHGFDVNTIKNKHKFLYNDEYPLDMIIIDETHYGSHSNVYGKAVGLANQKYEKNSEELKEAKKEADDVQRISQAVDEIKHKYTLQCSGTPYYILASGEFSEIYKNKEIISNVGFSDMIDARDKWVDEHPNEDESNSPYFGIPNLVKFGMNLTKECRNALKKNTDISTALSFLFKNKDNKFINENAIVELMESIFGSHDHKMPGFLDQKRIKEGEIFKHIIMVLPHIDDCHILKNLLLDKHIIEDDRKIIVATERRTAKNKGARRLDPEATDSETLNQALWKLEDNGQKSLTITVNRFLTGVSVPLWDAMFYMKDTASPQEYDQAIFRLCTRNVGKAKYTDENGVQHEQKICRKTNVYLIDFKIDRMYNMIVSSAVAQASYNPNSKNSIEDVKEIINKNMHDMPTYADSIYDSKGQYILNGIHQITADDLLKQYVKYNRERSIEDSIKLEQFNSFLGNLDNLKYLNRWNEGLLNQTKLKQKEGEDELDVDPNESNDNNSFDEAIERKQNKSSNNSGKGSKKEKQEIEMMKKKFTTMLKAVLYSCICMDKVPEDIMDYIEQICNDQNCEQIAKDFKIDVDELSDIISQMNNNEKMQINMLIYQLKQLLDDKQISPMQRVQNAVSKLGKLNKSEVITPQSLTSKMVKKLNKEDVLNADSILLVNEKVCEFLIQLYKDYGIDVCKKCRIVASSQLTMNFIRKILKTLDLNQSIIMDIGDVDENGTYDVKDFLQMKNEDILKMNNGKKFDIILSNAPYDNGLHEKFEAKYFDLCNGQICFVSPLSFLLGKRQNKRITEQIDKYTADIEQINGNDYFDANIGGTMGITYVNMNANIHHNRRYILFDGKEYDKCNEISQYSNDELLTNIKNKIHNLLNDNLMNHLKSVPGAKDQIQKYEYKPNFNWYIYRIKAFSGHSTARSKQIGEYYALTSNKDTYTNSCGIYKNFINRIDRTGKSYLMYYIVLQNEEELKNFWNYIHTDFVNIILYCYKTGLNLFRGVLNEIPFEDFSIAWDDYKLFKKYNFTKEEVKHIYNILPNYYNIKRINLNNY